LQAFGSFREIIGRLAVIAPLNDLGIDDLVRILPIPRGSLIQRFRKLVRFHGAELFFTNATVRKIAKIAMERGRGARGLRSVVEEVMNGVLSEAGARYVITDKTVRGWGDGKAQYDANEGTAELACDAAVGGREQQ
jgi:ATP-dependent Clp protease ATP-binding subunit ClpX